jgi:hypothetical protein
LPGNPGGVSKTFREARRLASQSTLEMVEVLLSLARNPATDERVRSVCAIVILDRAGLRPIEGLDPAITAEERRKRLKIDYEAYSVDELRIINAAMKLLSEQRGAGRSEAEILPRNERNDPGGSAAGSLYGIEKSSPRKRCRQPAYRRRSAGRVARAMLVAGRGLAEHYRLRCEVNQTAWSRSRRDPGPRRRPLAARA